MSQDKTYTSSGPRITRRQALRSGAALAGLLAAGATRISPAFAAEGEGDGSRPNILFFLVDDLGMMDLGTYNPDTFYETPNVDRLAEEGMKFNDAYGTNPVCSPTRFGIMSGKYPSRHDATNWFTGVRHERFRSAELNNYMPTEEVTLAEALRDGGYKTYFAGKWHLGDEPKYWPEEQGFDINIGGWTAGSPRAHGGGGYFSPYNNPRLEDGPEGEFLTERLTDETIAFLRDQQDEDAPFFAYLAFYQVHTPLQAPQELIEKYEAKARELGLDELDEDELFEEEEQVWPTDNPRRVRVRQTHTVYAAMVEAMDRGVGRVLDALEELGLKENTLIIFTSDDGGLATSEGHPTSNLPLRGGKGWLYEGGLRNPVIARWPGVVEAGSTCDTPTMNTDFYPGLLEAAGLPLRPEQHLDGVSMLPLLKGDEGAIHEREALYWHYPHYSNQGGFPGGAIRIGPWKLIERYEDGSVHLYNVVEDLEEQHDVADEHPDRVAEMRAKLHEWYEEVDAKFLRAREDGPEPWRPGDDN
ncbi:MAG: sulfatase [Candidatus Hydrogenedentota bacterium]